MSEVFPTNRGLWPMYRLMARAHRYAIDYIEQAPVIVLAARGKSLVGRPVVGARKCRPAPEAVKAVGNFVEGVNNCARGETTAGSIDVEL